MQNGVLLLLRATIKENEIKTFKALSKVKLDNIIRVILLFSSI